MQRIAGAGSGVPSITCARTFPRTRTAQRHPKVESVRMADFLHADATEHAGYRGAARRSWAALHSGVVIVASHRDSASTLLLLLIAAAAPFAHAQNVYKCTDHEGHIAYQAVACATGMRERLIEIEPAPPASTAPIPRVPRPSRTAPPPPSPRAAIVHSFECRTHSGALFYRHDRCPSSIDRSGQIGGRRAASRESVSARRIPRLDACRGMRSVGRDGREFDDVPSTYERNLGRDPCRKY